MRADGLGTVLGGVQHVLYTAFAQNVGLVAITGAVDRHVATCAGAILVIFGLLPKMGAIVEGIPQPVLGGAGVAPFGMVAASGIRTLSKVSSTTPTSWWWPSRSVALLTEASLYYTDRSGDEPVNVKLDLYHQFPDWFQTIFHSGHLGGRTVRDHPEPVAQHQIHLDRPCRLPQHRRDRCRAVGLDAPRGPAFDPATHQLAADPATTEETFAVPGLNGTRSAPVHRHQPVGTQGPVRLDQGLGDPKVLRLFREVGRLHPRRLLQTRQPVTPIVEGMSSSDHPQPAPGTRPGRSAHLRAGVAVRIRRRQADR